MSADFDFSGIDSLVADLGEVPLKVIPLVRTAVEVTARNIKEDWRAEAKGGAGSHARKYPTSIGYEMDLVTDGSIGATIKPKRGGQGNLGEVLEDGGGGVRSAPQKNIDKALRANLSDFEKGILKAGGDAL